MLLLTISGSARPSRAQEVSRVGLIVNFGGSTATRCVEFAESEISGYDVLMRSGLSVTSSFDAGPGAAICAIEGVGCPASACLTCSAPSYWSYWTIEGGSWQYAQRGSSLRMARDGGVEGWSWGEGGAPPMIPFDQICAPPAPTDTPPPTNTPEPTAAPATATAPLGPEAWFRLDQNPIEAGGCTMLRWDTSRADAAFLETEAVSLSDSREVCPLAHTDYRLRVTSAYGEQTYVLTLGVTGAAPSPTITPAPIVETTAVAAMQTVVEASPSATALTATTVTPTATMTPLAAIVHPTEPRPTETPTPVSSPTATFTVEATTPTATPGATAIPDGRSQERGTGWNYIAFVAIVAGLGLWLVPRFRRPS